jgi:hypothetical protein
VPRRLWDGKGQVGPDVQANCPMGEMCAKGGRVRAVCYGPHAAPYIWEFLYRGGKRRTLCDASTKRREQRAARRRQTPRDRGYDKAHVAERKRKLPAAYGQT